MTSFLRSPQRGPTPKSLFLLLSTFVLTVLFIYKLLGFLSLYPNDWFLDEYAYQKNPAFIEERSKGSRFLCIAAEYETFARYKKDFSKLLNYHKSTLRNHPHRAVFLIELPEGNYILKQYGFKNFYTWLKKVTIRSSLAYRSWHYGHELLKAGILTPKPLALYEKKCGPFWIQSYLITEYLEKSHGLDSQFKEASPDTKRALLDDLCVQLNLLNQGYFIHPDYGFRNLMVSNERVYLIDLDDLHLYYSRNIFFQRRFFKKHIQQLIQDAAPFSILQSNFHPL